MQRDGVENPAGLSRKRKTAVNAFLLIIACFAALIAADVYVASFSKGRLYDNPADIPHRRAAVVLGCGKYIQGRPNLFYLYRLNAAADLWHAGKIDAVLVSGDNSRKDYDEPTAMKADLVERGIPPEFIAVDYAGFRTLDSVIRAGEVFALDDYVVISQPFHCRRAVYLATRQGQSVIGYAAADVGGRHGLKVRLRETLARAAAVADILTSKQPRYLGPQEQMLYRNPMQTPENTSPAERSTLTNNPPPSR